MNPSTLLISLDFETYSDVNLPKHGMYRYMESLDFQPLLACATTVKWGDLKNAALAGDPIPMFRHEPFRLNRGATHTDEAWRLRELLETPDSRLVATNAAFEMNALDALSIYPDPAKVMDTAVIARAFGLGGSLGMSAKQLGGVTAKMEEGFRLIRLFCVPQKNQSSPAWDSSLPEKHPEDWAEFTEYCYVDTEVPLQILGEIHRLAPTFDFEHSIKHWELTDTMNNEGWPVDMKLLNKMEEAVVADIQAMEAVLARDFNGLKIKSNKGMREQFEKWGINTTSFDALHVQKMLVALTNRIEQMPDDPRVANWRNAQRVLQIKQQIGSSSVAKLSKIRDLVSSNDDRLRGQYMHVGAGQTHRATGVGAQLQNIPKFDPIEGPAAEEDVQLLLRDQTYWSLAKVSRNLRLLFKPDSDDEVVVVGDLSSIESRGLAYQAGAQWKLDAFHQGKDMYKVLAAEIKKIDYDSVLPQDRSFGKVGELGCGYQAGAQALKDFAEKMGVILTLAEATAVVNDWRDVNPEVVQFWEDLQTMLLDTLSKGQGEFWSANKASNLRYVGRVIEMPQTLQELAPAGARSMIVEIQHWNPATAEATTVVQRVLHGCYLVGGQIRMFKKREAQTGPVWRDWYMDPKSKKKVPYSIYGGKLAGIFTQSFCREIFYWQMENLFRALHKSGLAKIIGQFHDEIVVETHVTREQDSKIMMHREMEKSPPWLHGFPMAAKIESAARYIK